MGVGDSSSDGIVDRIQSTWQGVLDSLQEHGVPIRSLTDPLEEHGIPSLPALLIVFLLLIGLLVFFVLPNILAPATGTVSVLVSDANGNPVSGVQVTLSSTSGAFNPVTIASDPNGYANFSDIPAGAVTASIQSSDYTPTQQGSTAVAGEVQQVSLEADSVTAKNVNIYLNINGPTDGTQVTTELDDQYFNSLGTQTGLQPSFSLPVDTVFQIKVTANGFTEYDLNGQNSSDSDQNYNVTMVPLVGTPTANLHVMVYSLSGTTQTPIGNASVDVLDAITNAVIEGNLSTGDDGRITPIQLPIGDQVKVRASAPGFSTQVSDLSNIAAGDDEVDVQLRPLAGTVQTLNVAVLDPNGNPAQNPLIQLYSQGPGGYTIVKSDQPFSGTDSFLLQPGTTYSLSAYLPGSLPQYFHSVTGGTLNINMVASTPDNSGTIAFSVLNPDTSPAAGATISLTGSDGTPIGLPVLTTGIDGLQQMPDVPIGISVLATAQDIGRTGTAATTITSGNNSLTIQLLKANGTVQAQVNDYFSGNPIAGAVVTIGDLANGGGTCTTDSNGQCVATVLESTGTTATVSAAGYQPFESASFAVNPNTQTAEPMSLMSTSVIATSQPQFEGFFDSSGHKASTLAPSTQYTAKFLIQSPSIGFTNAQFFVYEGSTSTQLSSDDAYITSYTSPQTQRIIGGVDFSSANSFVAAPAGAVNTSGLDNASALPYYQDPVSQAASPVSEAGLGVAGASAYKWVSFEYGAFTGTQEADVVFQTQQVSNGTVDFNYRTAYATTNDIVRSPPDSQAGITESDLLAQTYTASANIGFSGTCNQDACVSLSVTDPTGSHPATSIAEGVGTSLNLNFNVLTNESLNAQVVSSGIELGVISGQSGANVAQVTSDSTGATTGTLPLSGSTGTFLIRAQRVSNDAYIRFSLVGNNGASVFDQTLFVRVNSQGNPSLKVVEAPINIQALEPQQFTFNVTDTLGLPVTGATVTVGNPSDALGNTVQAQEVGPSEPGTYVAQGVDPQGVGALDYTVSATGFQLYTGSVPVGSTSILDSKGVSLSLSVNSIASPATASFVLDNLVTNSVQSSAVVVKDSAPQYLVFAVTPTATQTVDGQGTVTYTLTASVDPSVMGVATTPQTLQENVTGYVLIHAKAGGSSQSIKVPFSATLDAQQQDIDTAFSATPSNVQIALSPPDSLTGNQVITVTNTGPDPLIINQQPSQSIASLSITPISLNLAPGTSGEFTVAASASSQFNSDNSCIFNSTNQSGTLQLIASFQGVQSDPTTIPVTVSTQASGTCAPNNPISLTLPVALTVNLPTDAQVRSNDDGSLTVQLSSGGRMQLGPGAVQGTNSIALAAGSTLTLDGQYVTSDNNGNVTVTLPVASTLAIPAGTPLVKWPSATYALFTNERLSLPLTLAYSVDSSGNRNVNLPASTSFVVQTLNAPDLTGLVSATLPANIDFSFPANSVERNQPDGGFSVQLPDGSLYGFDADTQMGTIGPDGSLYATAPIGSTILLPNQYATSLSDGGFSFQLPFPVSVEVPSGTQVAARGANVVAYLSDYDLSLPGSSSFQASAGGEMANVSAGGQVSFTSVSGESISADTFATLPMGLSITLPADARIEQTAVGQSIFLDNSLALGLPPQAQISAPALDGTRTAVVDAGTQTAWPSAWITPQQGSGWVLNPSLSYFIQVPQGTPTTNVPSGLDIQLPSYDVILPSGSTLGQTSQNGFLSSTPITGPLAINAAPTISSTGLIPLVLPVPSSFSVPPGSRIDQTGSSVLVLLASGQVVGFNSPAQLSSDYSTITSPAQTTLLFPPSMATASDNGTTLTTPGSFTLTFDSTYSLFRKSSLEFVSDQYSATLPSSSVLTQSGSGTTAQVPSGNPLSFAPADFSVLGQQRLLPLELTFAVPPNSVSRQLQDGTVFIGFGTPSASFGIGSTLTGNIVDAPAQTTATLSSSLSEAALLPGSGSSTPSGYTISLPVPYTWVVTSQLSGGLQTDGDGSISLALPSMLVIFPKSSTSTQAPSGTTGQTTAASGSTTIVVPAFASTTFYQVDAGSLSPQTIAALYLSASQAALTNAQSLQALAATNTVVVPEFGWTLAVKPPLSVITGSQTGGVVAIPLSSSQVILLPQTVEVNNNTVSNEVDVTIPAGTQVSLPSALASATGSGGWRAQLPLSSTVSVPSGTQIINDPTDYAAELNSFTQEIIVPTSSPFSSPQGGSLVATLNPGSVLAVQPQQTFSPNGDVSVMLPFEAQLSFGANTRTSTQGTYTSVHFADGSTGQFPGPITPLASGTGEMVDWQPSTQAYLPPEYAQVNPATGGSNVTLPIPVTLILPPTAQFGLGGQFQAVFSGMTVSAQTSVAPQPVSNGYSVTIPAGVEFGTAPFGINIVGPTIQLPFAIQFQLPQGALYSQNTGQGGIGVQFQGGMMVDFGGASSITTASTQNTATAPASAYTAIATPIGGSFMYPPQYSAYSPGSTVLGFNSPTTSTSGSTLASVTVPANSPITFSPQLFTALSGSPVQSAALPLAYSFALPVPFQAMANTNSPAYYNPDGSVSVYTQSNEFILPPGTQSPAIPQGGAPGQGTVTGYYWVPQMAPVQVLPVYNGLFPGSSISLPYDLLLELPPTARVLPVANDGSRTIDFGNGQRVVFGTNLQLNQQSLASAGVPGSSVVDVKAGTTMVFTPGIVSALPTSVIGPLEAQAMPTGTLAFSLTLPIPSQVLVPSNSRIYPNPDGGQSAYLNQYEVRVPPAGPSLLSAGGSQTTFNIPAGGPVLVIPLQFSTPRQQALTLPVDATFLLNPTNRVLPPAPDGSRTVQFTPNSAIIFGAGVTGLDTATPMAKIPAGTQFTPSANLIQTSGQKTSPVGPSTLTSLTFTLPSAVSFSLPNSGQIVQNPDGTTSYLSGTIEFVLPQSASKSLLNPGPLSGTAGAATNVYTAPAGSQVVIKPIDSSISSTQITSLPVDLALQLGTGARVFPQAGDGTTVVKFSDTSAFVVNGITPAAGAHVLTIPANTPFSVTTSLIQLSAGLPPTTHSAFTGAKVPPSVVPSKLIVPVPSTITLTSGESYSFDPSSNTYSISTGYALVTVSGSSAPTAGPAGNAVFTLPAGSVIQITPLDYSTDSLQKIPGLPWPTILLFPQSAQLYSSPQAGANQYITLRSPSGYYKFVVDQSARALQSATGLSILLAQNSGFLAPAGSYQAAPADGYTITLPVSWALGYDPKQVKILPSGTLGTNSLKMPSGLQVYVPSGLKPQSAAQLVPSIQQNTLAGAGSTLMLQSASSPLTQTNVITGNQGASGAASTLGLQYLLIPANTPIRFSTTELELQSIAGGPVGTVKLKLQSNTQLAVATTASVTTAGNQVTVTFPGGCTQENILDNTGAAYLTTMQIVQLSFDSATFSPQPDGSGMVTANSGATLTLRTCPAPNGADLTYQQYFSSQTTLVLPMDTNKAFSSTATFPSCRQLSQFGTTAAQPVGGVTKLSFGSDPANVVINDPRVAVTQAIPGQQVGGTALTAVPAGTTNLAQFNAKEVAGANTKPTAVIAPGAAVGITVCPTPTSQAGVQLGGAGIQSYFTATPSITYTFTDGTTSISAQNAPKISLQNNGAVLLSISVPRGGVIATGDGAAFLDVPNMIWGGGGQIYQPHTPLVSLNPKQAPLAAQIPALIPPTSGYLDLLNPGCFLRSANLTAQVDFKAVSYDGTAYTAVTNVVIKIVHNPGQCGPAKSSENSLRMSGFYGTYAYSITGPYQSALSQTMSFKEPGQVRYSVLVNNLPYAVELNTTYTIANAPRAATCLILSPSSASGSSTSSQPSSQQTSTIDGTTMNSGTSLLMQCTSQPVAAGSVSAQSNYVVNANPVDSNGDPIQGAIPTLVTYQFAVFNPPANLASLYYSNPVGELAPLTASNALAASGLSNALTTPTTTASTTTSSTSSTTTTSSSTSTTQAAPALPPTHAFTPGGSQAKTEAAGGTLSLQATGASASSPTITNTAGATITGAPNSANGVTPPDAIGYTLCEEYYCNSAQVQSAIASRALALKSLVENSIPNTNNGQQLLSSINALEKQLGGTTITKAFVVQKAGYARITSLGLQSYLSQQFAQTGSPSQVSINQNDLESNAACGIYTGTVTVNLANPNFGGAGSGRANYIANLDYFVDIKLVQPCSQTVANSALLMGDDPNTLGVTVGMRVVQTSTEFGLAKDKILTAFHQGGITAALAAVPGSVSGGPYSHDPDNGDVTAAQNLVGTLYPAGSVQLATTAQPYEDAGFCSGNGGKQLASLGITATEFALGASVGTALSTAATAATGGAAAPIAFLSALVTGAATKLGVGALQASALCAGEFTGNGAASAISGGQNGGVCSAWNSCVDTAIYSFLSVGKVGGGSAASEAATAASATESSVPVGAAAILGQSSKQTMINMASTAALTTVISGAVAYLSPETQSATIPLFGAHIPQGAATVLGQSAIPNAAKATATKYAAVQAAAAATAAQNIPSQVAGVQSALSDLLTNNPGAAIVAAAPEVLNAQLTVVGGITISNGFGALSEADQTSINNLYDSLLVAQSDVESGTASADQIASDIQTAYSDPGLAAIIARASPAATPVVAPAAPVAPTPAQVASVEQVSTKLSGVQSEIQSIASSASPVPPADLQSELNGQLTALNGLAAAPLSAADQASVTALASKLETISTNAPAQPWAVNQGLLRQLYNDPSFEALVTNTADGAAYLAANPIPAVTAVVKGAPGVTKLTGDAATTLSDTQEGVTKLAKTINTGGLLGRGTPSIDKTLLADGISEQIQALQGLTELTPQQQPLVTNMIAKLTAAQTAISKVDPATLTPQRATYLRNLLTNAVGGTEADALLGTAPGLVGTAAETMGNQLKILKSGANLGQNVLKGGANLLKSISFPALIASTIANIDVRPVRAYLDPKLSNHIVVYHMENYQLQYGSFGTGILSPSSTSVIPTIYQYCLVAPSSTSGSSSTATPCDPSNSFYLAALCSTNDQACLYLHSTPTTATVHGGFTLFASINNPNLDSASLFSSVFSPEKPPLYDTTLAAAGGTLSASSISNLQSTQTAVGSGLGMASPASPPGLPTTTGGTTQSVILNPGESAVKLGTS